MKDDGPPAGVRVMPRSARSARLAGATTALWLAACGGTGPDAGRAAVPMAPPPAVAAVAPPPDGDTATSAAPANLPLGAIELTGDLPLLERTGNVALLLMTGRPDSLLSALRAAHPEGRPHEGGVLVGTGQLSAGVDARHLAPSFLVDYDEPAVEALAAQLPAGSSRADIAVVVATQLAEVRYGEFVSASRAVTSGAGDCSEHAVVAAALARKLGKPARVVTGYVLLHEADPPFALGHAWTQVYEDGAWVHLDATGIGDGHRAYLIVGEVIDEGPGFAMGLASTMAQLSVTRMRVLPVCALDGCADGSAAD